MKSLVLWTYLLYRSILATDQFKVTFTSTSENIVKGDTILEDGGRVLLLSTNEHLGMLAQATQIFGDGTIKICPKLTFS